MKLVAGFVMACQLVVFPALSSPQARQSDKRQHVAVADRSSEPSGSANAIWRDAPYPAVIHFGGIVEIKATGFILRADEADYNEATGEIEARGSGTCRWRLLNHN